MNDDDRKHLYLSLLRGLAQTAQDRLCASDQQHAWGQWMRHELKPDLPFVCEPAGAEMMNRTVRTRSERRCLNCGKEQHA